MVMASHSRQGGVGSTGQGNMPMRRSNYTTDGGELLGLKIERQLRAGEKSLTCLICTYTSFFEFHKSFVNLLSQPTLEARLTGDNPSPRGRGQCLILRPK